MDGFAGHVVAPGSGGGFGRGLERFDHIVLRGPQGRISGIIVRGPRRAAPPLPRPKPVRTAAPLGGALLNAALPNTALPNTALPGRGPSLLKPGMRPLIWPIQGVAISSGYGIREHPILGGRRPHHGVDLPAHSGTPVRAAADGIIRFRGRNGGYGRFIRLDHGFGLETAYGHLRGYGKGLRRGARVRRGEVIGYAGSSGLSTGPHLHYEVRVNGRAVDPLRFLPGAPRRVRIR